MVMQEAHEALYEIACGAETAQRTVHEGLSALSGSAARDSPCQARFPCTPQRLLLTCSIAIKPHVP